VAKSVKGGAKRIKTTCKRCIQGRWLMTFIVLSSMLTVLYLNEFAS
jgi:hypothetical protein